MPDWKNFRLSKLTSPEYNHLFLLLYWIVYLVLFQLLEHWTERDFNILYSVIDEYIPFNEYFVIPYLFWFVYMFGMSCYTVFFDRDSFIYYMKLIIFTSLTACVSYFIYPSALELRPVIYERDNIFVDITRFIYDFDTSTNVCPSMHVTGSIITMLTGFRVKKMKNNYWRGFHIITAILICASTVFMKQHSIIDVFWAIVVCLVAQFLVVKTENKYFNRTKNEKLNILVSK